MSGLLGDSTMLRHGLATVYVAPNETAYRLLSPFTITTENGTLLAVAFSARAGQFLNTSLTVIFTLMFAWFWGLIAAATIYFVPYRFSRRRLVALVALRNSQDPWSAFMAFAGYTTESMGLFRRTDSRVHGPMKLRKRRSGVTSPWQDTLFGFVLLTLALIVILTRIILSIILPPSLQIGNVAPVNGSAVFYPRSSLVSNSSATYRAFRGGTSLWALSSVQISRKMIQDRVKIEQGPIVTSADPAKPMYAFTYSYAITGIELGLKRADDLVLTVNGACRTEYGWLAQANNSVEILEVFGETNNTFTTRLEGGSLNAPPVPGFYLSSDFSKVKSQYREGNVSYAILATLSNRRSKTANEDDPWYLTEPVGGNSSTYRIRQKRPALSCWHHDRWSAGGEYVDGGANLSDLKPLGIPEVLRAVLGTALLYPMPYVVGIDAGASALVSVLTAPSSVNGNLDANGSSIHQDMERLIMGGYIATLNLLSTTVLYNPTPTEMVDLNLFYNKTTHVALDGRDEFLVSSPSIATFNLVGLVATGAIVVFLLFGKLMLTAKLVLHTPNKHAGGPRAQPHSDDLDPHQEADRFNDDRWARFRAFSAVHLLRNTYEDGTGKHDDDWQCSDDLPSPTDEKMLRLVRCHHANEGCAGHIATDPELLLGIRAASRASVGGGGGKRARTSITSIPENASYRAYDPVTGRTQTLSRPGSLPGYTPVGQFEMRAPEEVNGHRASVTSSNAGNAGNAGNAASTSYAGAGSFGTIPPSGSYTPYSSAGTPPTGYFSSGPSVGGTYFHRQSPPLMTPPAHGGAHYGNPVHTPYRDEDEIAVSPSTLVPRNSHSAPLLSLAAQGGREASPQQNQQHEQQGHQRTPFFPTSLN